VTGISSKRNAQKSLWFPSVGSAMSAICLISFADYFWSNILARDLCSHNWHPNWDQPAFPGQQEQLIMQQAHTKAAEHHENAAKAHRNAAEQHGKNDHVKGKEHSVLARQHSKTANEHSETAHGKSSK
jgi:hypothetical protein